MTNLLSRKSQDVEGFQFSWAFILFETQAGTKRPRLPILKKNKDLFTDNIYFSKQTKYSIVLRIPMQYESLTRNLDKKCQIELLIFFKVFIAKNVIVFQKNSSFERLEIASAKKNFWKAFWRKTSLFSVFENFQVFFGKKTSLFPKNPNIWTSSKHMTNSKVRDVFEKKTCEIKCFWKFQNVFFKWSIYFSQKGQILKVLRILGQWILWYLF